MKTTIILFALFITCLCACTSDTTKSFIAGTYISETTGDYSAASDTLVIEASEGNNFLIHRKTGFNRIRNGKKGIREYKAEQWQAIYDESTRSLTEVRYGKHITFYPETGKLMVGNRTYQKQ